MNLIAYSFDICPPPPGGATITEMPELVLTPSSMASSLTMFLWLTFLRTSNSRICTSWGRMWLSWLNVLTATGSPFCCQHRPR